MKLPTFLETPTLWVTHFIVRGRVAEEEAVEKAVSIAGAIAFRWLIGLISPRNLNITGRIMRQ